MPTLKERVKAIRKELNMTQGEYADATGISLSLIKKIEAGTHDNITEKTRKALFENVTPKAKNEQLRSAA